MKHGGLQHYNKAASQQYANLTEIDKKELLKSDETKPKPVMNKQQIKTSGKKIFKKIQKHVGYYDFILIILIFLKFEELERLGFEGFAIGFHHQTTEFVGTKLTVN